MRRLSLLLLVLLAVGCGSKTKRPQVVIAVKPVDASAVDAHVGADALVKRLELLGVPRSEIRVVQRGGGVAVELPRSRVPARGLRAVTKTATLELYDLEKAAGGAVTAVRSLYALLAGQQPRVEFQGGDHWDLFDTKTKRLVAGPFANPDELFRTRLAKTLHVKPGKPPYVVFGVPKHTNAVFCGSRASACPGISGPPSARSWYLFKHDPQLTGSDVDLSATRAELDPAGIPVVLIRFKDVAARAKFRALTRMLYQRGALLSRAQHVAIVVDGEILSFPQIDYTDTTLANGISGDVQITGLNSFREAKGLALALQAGALPFRFVRVR